MTLHTVKANFQAAPEGVRHDVFEGHDHLVVPVVMIVEGVMNDAMVPASEFGRYPNAWDGRPIPVLHPQEHGGYISANRPDVIERSTIGQIFNTRVENGKLKTDAWINTAKAQRLGFGDLVAQLEAGEVIEVSTGYFSDDERRAGEFNGVGYNTIHRNIRPDHLALLPGEIGACSVADGCGTRVNQHKGSFAMKVNEAWSVITKSLGLKSNCQCEGDHMAVMEQAEAALKANAITPAQFKMVQEMAPEDREMLGAIIGALGNMGGGEPESAEGMPEDEMPEAFEGDKDMDTMSEKTAPKAQEQAPDIDALVANKVAEHLRRHDVVGKLAANEKNTLTEGQMKAMSVEQLEAVEKMIRPADYSGQGGFAANSDAIDTNVTPMGLRGVLGGKRKEG